MNSYMSFTPPLAAGSATGPLVVRLLCDDAWIESRKAMDSDSVDTYLVDARVAVATPMPRFSAMSSFLLDFLEFVDACSSWAWASGVLACISFLWFAFLAMVSLGTCDYARSL